MLPATPCTPLAPDACASWDPPHRGTPPPGAVALDADDLATLLGVLLQLGDAQLLTTFFQRHLMTARHALATLAPTLVVAVQALGWAALRPLLLPVVQQQLGLQSYAALHSRQRDFAQVRVG